ncbi:MAG: type II toxin-antitoxin system RelE/ParE family toxin [Saccharospirillaceae bacterium]|nr:type II toxin-antitoxin system RelE/ParE family toxin [Saccharospirillaceae bacterium]MCD8530628.1 type II toxin-antitoxin system RelE/ParE family toxin [Saccharospirillaceae bacterium]
MAIKSFKSKALKKYRDGDFSKVKPDHVDKIGDILSAMHASHHPKDLKAIFRSLEEKKGSGACVFTIQVNGNWRVTFQVEDDGAILVDYCDYHGKHNEAVK